MDTDGVWIDGRFFGPSAVKKGDYVYSLYNIDNNKGWKVELVGDRTKTEYGPIESEIDGIPVIFMDSTFCCCTNLTTAPVIPSSVMYMEETFYKCTSLTTLPVLPEGIEKIDTAFMCCDSLTDLSDFVIPNSVKDMKLAFRDCKSLTTAPEIPNSVTNMRQTFYRCTSLTTAPVIPSSVTDMDDTFNGCINLTGAITINATPRHYLNCLYRTRITEILGDCADKDALLRSLK